MLLKLHGRHLRPLASPRSPEPFLARVCTNRELPMEARATELLLADERDPLPEGFRGYLVRKAIEPGDRHDVYHLGEAFSYLSEGDVVRIEPDRRAMAVLYRRSSAFNSMLVTERCDNYCVMCSQPPKQRADDYLVDELLQMIPWMSPDTAEIGLTGGEPALLGERLVAIVDSLGRHLPQTAVHILSNGRAFADESFARALADLHHPDLMLGIPLYGALPEQHDYIVQRRGAYDQTVRGILNLKRHGVRVELRFVIHAETYAWLPSFARFVARNLVFVDHLALMGLELMGFARANLDALWIDPLDYQPQLVEAAMILTRAGVPLSIYNHQLCVLDPRLHPLARQSISDWKNCYFDECAACTLRSECGGFFASSVVRRSRGIAAVEVLPAFQPSDPTPFGG
jgi:His-Xaa-Ser system radical SAM maturase HxsC